MSLTEIKDQGMGVKGKSEGEISLFTSLPTISRRPWNMEKKSKSLECEHQRRYYR